MGKSLKGKELGSGISQRNDGRYQARFVNRFGKRETLYAKTLPEIRQKLREAQYANEKQMNVIKSNMTLDEWFEIWMNTYKAKIRYSTKFKLTSLYRKHISHFIGDKPLDKLTSMDIQMVINNAEGRSVPFTAFSLLSDCLNIASAQNLIQDNIISTKVIQFKRYRAKPRVVLDEATLKLFLERTAGNKWHDVYLFAVETGLRVGEICALQKENLDFKNRRFFVKGTISYVGGEELWKIETPKTDTGIRVVPMTDTVYEILKKSCEKSSSNFVFENKNRHLISGTLRYGLITNIKKIQKDYPDFPDFAFHSFRHTFATRCIERGMRPKTLQAILGHSNISMTMNLYCHVTEQSLNDEMDMCFGNGVKRV